MKTHTQDNSDDVPWMGIVRACVEELAFGAVEITVHEQRVVQVEKRERYRLSLSHPLQSGGKSGRRQPGA